MKKATALASGLLLLLTAAGAAGSSDPLISLSYLTGTYSQSLNDAIAEKLDASDAAVLAEYDQDRDPASPVFGPSERTLKEGDTLSGSTGLMVTPLGGSVRLNVSAGAVVDVTAGTEASNGQTLMENHRYLVAEDAAADFNVTSPAAVLVYEGSGTLAPSRSPDYYAISCALRELDLFRGSGSGIGEGFELYHAPSRGEGLVMFLRILGEEEKALAFTGTHPFTDVPGWLDPYAAWAYQRGYANGVSAERFGCTQPISAVEYEEFLLRALGYSDVDADDYAASLERALDCGALTPGEYDLLRAGNFTRAHAAYLSYYALDVPISGGDSTLAQRLVSAGRLTEEQLASARSRVDSLRIS